MDLSIVAILALGLIWLSAKLTEIRMNQRLNEALMKQLSQETEPKEKEKVVAS